MSVRSIIIFVSLLFVSQLYSQGGAYINGGFVWGTNQYQGITPDGEVHLGVKVGLDAGLNSGNMFFLPGVHFMRLDFDTGGDSFFSPVEPLDIIKLRFGLGFIIMEKGRFKLRARAQGAMHFVTNAHTIDFPNGVRLNEGYAGADLGLGISFGALTADIEYEKGFVNGVFMMPDTNYDFIYATVGFFF